MTKKSSTGDVRSSKGKVTARNIIAGIKLEGKVSDETLQAALQAMEHLSTGSVSGALGVEVSEDIVTGLHYTDKQRFFSGLQDLRSNLAAIAAQGLEMLEIGYWIFKESNFQALIAV